MASTRAGRTILCVDDYESILAGWKMLFESEGYEVLTAANSSQALQLFGRCPIDEVILDHQLTDLPGDIVARYMKAAKPNVPILMVSDDDSPPQEKLSAAEAFLFKSTPIKEFLRTVKALLSKSRTQLNLAGNPSVTQKITQSSDKRFAGMQRASQANAA